VVGKQGYATTDLKKMTKIVLVLQKRENSKENKDVLKVCEF
jgi:hypothetical protein